MKNGFSCIVLLLACAITVSLLLGSATFIKAENVIAVKSVPPPVSHNWIPPHLEPHKSVTPREIWVKNSGNTPENATVTLTVNATGSTDECEPADIVLLFDCTDSMSKMYNGHTRLDWLKDAVITFLYHLHPDDRAAIAEFHGEGSNGSTPIINLVQGFTNSSIDLNTAILGLSCAGKEAFFSATIFSVDYANQNHWPPGQTHPHYPQPIGHHRPVVVTILDSQDPKAIYDPIQPCLEFINESHNPPPPLNHLGYETTVYTVALTSESNRSWCEAIAQAGGGKSFYAPEPINLTSVYGNISNEIHWPIVATQPSPVESMITDVFPPIIDLQPINPCWWPTVNNSVMIRNFDFVQGLGGMWEGRWHVTQMRTGDIFEVQYTIKSSQSGWQSVGITSYNATNVYTSDFCHVKYLNYQYFRTRDAGDIWTNETPDVSIFVKEPPVPEPSFVIMPALSLIALFFAVKRAGKRKTDDNPR